MHSNHKASQNTFRELSIKNVRNSAKDYLIYFITLMISVALFYSFNSISTQFAALGMLDRLSYLSFTSGVLGMISVLVCFIIGNLVVYVNHFMLRRRKREIGIYYTLGIENQDLNRMLLRESLIIGTVSLVVGILLGIMFSQLLTLVTGKLINIGAESFRFIISIKALILSILFFLILFVFVYNMNKKEIKKMTLLELLSSERKNEAQSKNSGLSGIIGGIAGIVLALVGYGIILSGSAEDIFYSIGGSIVILIASTFLLLISISGIIVGMMKKNKAFYYKKLNPFMVSQISSHMKKEAKYAALTGSLLLLALTMPIVGLGLGRYNVKDLDMLAPYDATIAAYENQYDNIPANPMEELQKNGFRLEDYAESWTEIAIYSQDGEDVVGLEDYNHAMKLQGKNPISLEENQFAVNYNSEDAAPNLQRYEQNPNVTVGNTELILKSNAFYNNNLYVTNVLMDHGTLIVPQHVTEGLARTGWILNCQFKGDARETLLALTNMDVILTIPEGFSLQTRDDAIMSVTSANIVLTYIGVYLGIVFLITAGAVLALQQLAQFSDNQKRYELLRKLGAERSDMRHSVVSQLRIYFGLPFGIALIHSAVIILGTYQHLLNLGMAALAWMAGICFAILCIIYIIYFMAAYTGSKRILNL